MVVHVDKLKACKPGELKSWLVDPGLKLTNEGHLNEPTGCGVDG